MFFSEGYVKIKLKIENKKKIEGNGEKIDLMNINGDKKQERDEKMRKIMKQRIVRHLSSIEQESSPHVANTSLNFSFPSNEREAVPFGLSHHVYSKQVHVLYLEQEEPKLIEYLKKQRDDFLTTMNKGRCEGDNREIEESIKDRLSSIAGKYLNELNQLNFFDIKATEALKEKMIQKVEVEIENLIRNITSSTEALVGDESQNEKIDPAIVRLNEIRKALKEVLDPRKEGLYEIINASKILTKEKGQFRKQVRNNTKMVIQKFQSSKKQLEELKKEVFIDFRKKEKEIKTSLSKKIEGHRRSWIEEIKREFNEQPHERPLIKDLHQIYRILPFFFVLTLIIGFLISLFPADLFMTILFYIGCCSCGFLTATALKRRKELSLRQKKYVDKKVKGDDGAEFKAFLEKMERQQEVNN